MKELDGKKSKINTCSENVIATVDKHVTVHEIANVVRLYSNSKTNDKETFKAPYKVKTFMWENYKSAHSSHALRCCCCCPGNW